MLNARIRKRGFNASVALRQQNEIAREVAYDVGLFWHQNYLDRHFTREGAKAYGYEPRQGDLQKPFTDKWYRTYTGRKYRTFGHRDPLKFTGRSYRYLKLPRFRITATRGVAKLRILLGAPAFNFKNFRGGRSKVNMAKDISTLLDSEKQAMTEVARNSFHRRYQALHAVVQ